jgi:hypothetical protein
MPHPQFSAARMSFIAPDAPPVFSSYASNTQLSFTGDATLFVDNNDSITFAGTGDTISLGKSSNDTLHAIGKNQTASFAYCGSDTVMDAGQGLNLSISVLLGHMDVHGFEQDLTGKITLANEPFALAPDGHGGTLLSLNFGGTSPSTVDFINDPHVTAAQIHTHA